MKHTVHVRGREAAEAMLHLVAAARHRLRSSDMEFHWDDNLRGWEPAMPQCTGATLTFELEEGKMSRTYEDGLKDALAVAQEWMGPHMHASAWTASMIASGIREKLASRVCGKPVGPECVLGNGHAGPCIPQCLAYHGPGGSRCIRQQGHGP